MGGVPTVSLDVPICSVFLFLFIVGAVCHMTILQVNLRRGHKFVISGMMFGFCMSRIATMIMRIAWATRPTNAKIAIAASIFVAAGVVLLFIVNLLFAQRIVRACHPNAGWHPLFHWTFVAIYVLIVLTLCSLVSSVIDSFFSLNTNAKRIDRDILLYGQTFYCVIAFLPVPLVLGGLVIPRKTRLEKFGHGRFRLKIAFLLGTTFLLSLGACFRTGANFAGGNRPGNDPAGYQSKACFYIFNFTIEIIVILFYVVIRVDKRFYVPDHSKKPGDYSRGPDFYTKKKQEQREKEKGDGGLDRMIAPEEEVFDNMSPGEVADHDNKMRGVDEEKGLPSETGSHPEPIAAPKPARGAGLSTRMPSTPAATPFPDGRLPFPGQVIPTSNF